MRRSKESSDSDNSDGINGSFRADQPSTTTFDVERIPYDATDHLDTLSPMVIHTNTCSALLYCVCSYNMLV